MLNTFGSNLIVQQGTLRPIDQVTGPGPLMKVAWMEKGKLFQFLKGWVVRRLTWASACQVRASALYRSVLFWTSHRTAPRSLSSAKITG